MKWLHSRINSFGFAFKGLWQLFRYEANAQIHLIAMVVVCFTGLYFKITPTEWALVAIAIGMVVAAEAFNSAIEKVTDSIYKEKNETAGKIKDLAAGGVLFCALIAIVIAVLVFFPYIRNCLN
jgi:diacylglycerol kinase (ATP)